MALLDVTIVNVAIPSMRAGLDTSTSTIQWVVSGYALTFGMTLVAGGRLGDAYGRRRLMLIGLVGFVLASAAVGLAPGAGLVVAARLLQAAAAGLLTPQNSGLIQEFFTGAERGRAFGLFGLTVSIAAASGPLLGGLIIAAAGEDDGWRWLFLVNVPIGLAALVAIVLLVPQPDAATAARTDPASRHIDVIGAVLLGVAVLALLFPIVSLEAGARLPLVLLIAVPLLLVAFVRWERRTAARGRAPLLDLGLLRSLPGYTGGLVVGSLYFTGFTGLFLVLSLYLQEGLGRSPLQAALLLVPFAVGSAVSSPIAGRLVTGWGRRLTIGALVLMVSGVVVAVATVGIDVWWLVPTMFVAGLGGGAVVSPNFTLTLAEVPAQMGGAAGGALQTGQRIGSAIGAALLVTVYEVSLGPLTDLDALRLAMLAGVLVLLLAVVAAIRTGRDPVGRSS